MPISKFQSDVLRLLAAQRSPDSYVRLESAVAADEAALAGAGYRITWPPTQRTAKREAIIEKNGEQMQLEWVTDSAFRFFPTQPDELFGYVLHPVDLATNKASAAADRRVPRDVVDLVTIHENILPLGAVVAAACGKFKKGDATVMNIRTIVRDADAHSCAGPLMGASSIDQPEMDW